MKKVYLKENFVAEALVDNWYAWAHLISPATAAMNIKNRHLPILKSYIMAPAAHAAAVKNPKMLGGPFIDYEGKRVDEIKTLLESTQTQHANLLEFASALEELDKLLKQEATGYNLHDMYEKIPSVLRGYVELVYDLNNNPSIRIKESLLYRSEFYKPEMQSLAAYLLYDDDRPFVFSTPRLEDPEKIRLNLPFDSPAIDELFKMQRVPQTFEYIADLLELTLEQRAVFQHFFTEEKPNPYDKYEGEHIRTRYFGHASILIETKNTSILVDPVISYEYETDMPRLTFKDLPDEIDYVLITHNHQDHILLETVLQLRHKVKHFVVPRNGGGALQDPSLRLMMNACGFNNVIELDELDDLEIPNGKITGLPFFGEHADLDIHAKLGYFINIDGYKVLTLADSNNIEPKLYEHIQKIYGNVDVLFLGMECDGAPMSWLYGPYLSYKMDRDKDQSRRLSGSNYEAGIDIVKRFNCKEVYVYAMGQEPWIKYITSVKYTDESNPIIQSNKLIEECKENGIIAERLFGTRELFTDKVIV